MRRTTAISVPACRTLPLIIGAFLVLSLSGCAATTAARLSPEEPPMHSVSEFSDDEPIMVVNDPWEGFNRRMYIFNYHFDKYFFLPVVRGYEFVTPAFARKGISNFFNNIAEIRTLYNSIFQLKGAKALITSGRFLTNTTIGIAGLLDPATPLGLARQSEDFGQTLGRWGLGSGPYLVVPVLGPNTLRSACGFAADGGIRFAAVNAFDPFVDADNRTITMTGISALEGIDTRHREKFRYYESGYPFEYDLLRFLYHKRDELQGMK